MEEPDLEESVVVAPPEPTEACLGYYFGPDHGQGMVPIRGFDFIATNIKHFPQDELLLSGEDRGWKTGLRLRSLRWEKRSTGRLVKELRFDFLMASKMRMLGSPQIP